MAELPDKIDRYDFAAFYYLKAVCGAMQTENNARLMQENAQSMAFKDLISKVNEINKHLGSAGDNYQPRTGSPTYQELYTQLQQQAEAVKLSPEVFAKMPVSGKDFHAAFFRTLFEPELDLTKNLYQVLTRNAPENPLISDHRQMEQNLGRETVAEDLYDHQGNKRGLTAVDFSHPGSQVYEFVDSVLGRDYYPLMNVNMPYLYLDADKEKQLDNLGNLRRQCRMGTPVHQRFGVPSHNQGFVNYLLTKRPEEKGQDQGQDIQHVIINLQKMADGMSDPFPQSITRFAENRRTKKIHEYEDKMPWVAAITLPADSTYFQRGFNTHHGTEDPKMQENLNHTLRELSTHLYNNECDFYLSDSVKQKVFGMNWRNEGPQGIEKRLQPLFQTATEEILGGPSLDRNVTPSERQAVLFHFVKAHLTERILDDLRPNTFQINCKDAIDRGGVHMVWRHFVTMHKQGQPVPEEDFRRLLDMPASLVMGRPANHNRNLLWNCMKNYHNNLAPEQKQGLEWVPAWLDRNDPTKRYNLQAAPGTSAIALMRDTLHIHSKNDTKIKISMMNQIRRLLGRDYTFQITDNTGKKVKAAVSVDAQSNISMHAQDNLFIENRMQQGDLEAFQVTRDAVVAEVQGLAEQQARQTVEKTATKPEPSKNDPPQIANKTRPTPPPKPAHLGNPKQADMQQQQPTVKVAKTTPEQLGQVAKIRQQFEQHGQLIHQQPPHKTMLQTEVNKGPKTTSKVNEKPSKEKSLRLGKLLKRRQSKSSDQLKVPPKKR